MVARARVPDEPEGTRAALADALDTADVVVVSGGVSVGPHDHVKPALRDLGVEERFWGVRLRPGKPTWFGARGSTLAFGLPGNPVSAMVTFQLFARPALAALQGAAPDARRVAAVLESPIPRNPQREQAIRVRLASEHERAHRGADEGRPGLARAHIDGRRRRPRADRRGRGRGARGRARGGRAPVRPRDPRRLLERHMRARARVTIIHEPQSHGAEQGERHREPAGGRGHASQGGAREALVARAPREPRPHLLELPVALLARPDPRALQRGLARGGVPAPALRPAPLPQAGVRGQAATAARSRGRSTAASWWRGAVAGEGSSG